MLYYNIILNILFIPIFVFLIFLSMFNIRLRKTFLKRFSFNKLIKFSKNNKPVWFHCSSLGEFNTIKNVISELQKKYQSIFITTSTDTGYQAAIKFLGINNVTILPLDFNFLLKRFISQLNPLILIIEETEIWPNLIFQTGKKGIPILYTNCIISKKSFRSYSFLRNIIRQIFKYINIFFIQNQETSLYLKKFYVPNNKIKYIGNIKFDLNIPNKTNINSLKAKLNLQNVKIITAGSTRKGEDEILLNVLQQLKKSDQNYKLIIAPRHLDRVQYIKELIQQKNLSFCLYSKPIKNYDVLIADQMGILLDMYQLCDIAFIGGTLVPIGGHNPIEAAYYKKPTFFGKYIYKNQEAFSQIMNNKGGIMINNEQDFYKKARNLLKNHKQLEIMSERAYKVIAQNKGASKKIVQYIISNYIK